LRAKQNKNLPVIVSTGRTRRRFVVTISQGQPSSSCCLPCVCACARARWLLRPSEIFLSSNLLLVPLAAYIGSAFSASSLLLSLLTRTVATSVSRKRQSADRKRLPRVPASKVCELSHGYTSLFDVSSGRIVKRVGAPEPLHALQQIHTLSQTTCG